MEIGTRYVLIGNTFVRPRESDLASYPLSNTFYATRYKIILRINRVRGSK